MDNYVAMLLKNSTIDDITNRIRDCAAYDYQSFITWEEFTLAYMRKIFIEKGLQGKYYE